MKKIKILKNNRKSKFMLISLAILAFLYLLFGTLMFFSPAVIGETGIDESFEKIYSLFYDRDYKRMPSILSFIFYKDGYFIFVPNKITLFYLPWIIGGSILFLILTRIIIHNVGYNNKTKKGVARIVKPIRGYQLTMIICWIGIVLLVLGSLITLNASAPFSIGLLWEYSFKGTPMVNSEIVKSLSDILTESADKLYKAFYWPSLVWFYDGLIYMAGDNELLKWGWILTPTLLILPILFISFIGVIIGECAWWNINIAVLKDIDAYVGTQLTPKYEYVKKPNLKSIILEAKENKSQTSELSNEKEELKRKCLNYYRTLLKMLEISKNTNSSLYTKNKNKYDFIVKTKDSQNWNFIFEEIKENFQDLTHTDQRFVKMIENLTKRKDLNIFGRYLDDLTELINDYWVAIETWNILVAESVVEQIFAIAFRKEALLAKVGYCIKERLTTHFRHIQKEANYLRRLDEAKQAEDYEDYRDTCLEVLQLMSPIKTKLSNYANKIIYN